MMQKSEANARTCGAPFFNEMSEFMKDLSAIPALAEKLAEKMEEMSRTATGSGKRT